MKAIKFSARAGKGGAGAFSYNHQPFTPRTPPDGGNGGKGGNFLLQIIPSSKPIQILNPLSHLKIHPKVSLSAMNGGNGTGSNGKGKTGLDLIIGLSKGSTLTLERKKWLLDTAMLNEGQQVFVQSGGEGGLGNQVLRHLSNFEPEIQNGKVPQHFDCQYDYFYQPDICLIGWPNVGKSSLLSAISNKQSAVEPYAFSTTECQLGTVQYPGEPFWTREHLERNESEFWLKEVRESDSNGNERILLHPTFQNDPQGFAAVVPKLNFSVLDFPGFFPLPFDTQKYIPSQDLKNNSELLNALSAIEPKLFHPSFKKFQRQIPQSILQIKNAKIISFMMDLSNPNPLASLYYLISQFHYLEQQLLKQFENEVCFGKKIYESINDFITLKEAAKGWLYQKKEFILILNKTDVTNDQLEHHPKDLPLPFLISYQHTMPEQYFIIDKRIQMIQKFISEYFPYIKVYCLSAKYETGIGHLLYSLGGLLESIKK